MESDYQTVTPEDVDIVGRRWDGVSIEPKYQGGVGGDNNRKIGSWPVEIRRKAVYCQT